MSGILLLFLAMAIFIVVAINVVALVRSFRSIPIDEFDRMAMPLLM